MMANNHHHNEYHNDHFHCTSATAMKRCCATHLVLISSLLIKKNTATTTRKKRKDTAASSHRHHRVPKRETCIATSSSPEKTKTTKTKAKTKPTELISNASSTNNATNNYNTEGTKSNCDCDCDRAITIRASKALNRELQRLIRHEESDVEAAERLLLDTMTANYYGKADTTLCVNVRVPDNVHFGMVIHGWAKRGNARRAEALLRKLEALYNTYSSDDNGNGNNAHQYCSWLEPSVVIYTSVIHAHARSRERGSAERAERVLHRVKEMNRKNSNLLLQPDVTMYNAVMDAWSKSGGSWAAIRAKQIFDEMKSGHVKPNAVSYTTLIYALVTVASTNTASSSTMTRDCVDAIAREAEALLEEMERMDDSVEAVQPNYRTYNAVINVLAKSGAVDRAFAIIQRMEAQNRLNENSNCRPDAWTYTTLIDGLTRIMTPMNAAAMVGQAEEMVKYMEETSSPSMSVKPNYCTYNALINCYAAALSITATNFTSTVNDNGNDSTVSLLFVHEIRSKVEALLNSMEQGYAAGNVSIKPDAVTYSTVIKASVQSMTCCSDNDVSEDDIPQRALQVLNQMEQHLHTNVEREGTRTADKNIVRPNVVAYRHVISAWMRRKSRGKDDLDAEAQVLADLVERIEHICGAHQIVADNLLFAVE